MLINDVRETRFIVLFCFIHIISYNICFIFCHFIYNTYIYLVLGCAKFVFGTCQVSESLDNSNNMKKNSFLNSLFLNLRNVKNIQINKVFECP